MVRLRIRVFNHILSRAHRHFPFHCFPVLIFILLAGAALHAQPGETASAQMAAAPQKKPEFLDRQEVFRRIGLYEEFARNANSLHLDNQSLVKVYRNLGALYVEAGMIPNAAAATQRAIDLMKDGPQDKLADEYNNLSSIHGLMGNLKQSEKDQMHALEIREKIGDPLGIALTWTDMAGVYYQERKFEKALAFAQKGYDVLGKRTDMNPTDHIAVLQTMAFALCDSHQCSNGVPIMKQAVEEAKRTYGPESLSAAAQGFALGYLYWRDGDTTDAAEWMRLSLARMKTFLGWGAPLYVNSMQRYVKFLHDTGERDEARNTEGEIHTLESVVDARSLMTRGEDLLSKK